MDNQEIIQKWVEALRSGEYKQGVGKLKYIHHPSGETLYCCLGVLCEVMGVESEVTNDGTAYMFIDPDTSLTCYTRLPGYVVEKLNISYLGDFREEIDTVKGKATSLSYINDGLELDFNQIADIIEKQYSIGNMKED